MSTRPEPINAIAYAQFHLRGGFRGLLLIMLGTLLLAGLMAVMMFSSEPNRTQQTAEGMVQSLLGLQWLILALFGGSRVVAGVRGDLTSGLIESHRITPTPPLAAVAGYVFAAPMQAVAVAFVVLLCGAAAAVVARIPVSIWLIGNLMALAAAVMIWSLAALVSFATKQAATLPVAAAIGGSMIANLIFVPAVMVLASPIAGQSLWLVRRTNVIAPAYFYALIAYGLLSGVFFLAAARRYRSVVTDAFNIPLGLLLLTIVAAITIVGQAVPNLFWSHGMMGQMADWQTQLIAGLCTLMAVALIPVAAIARAAVMPPEMAEPGRPRVSPPLYWLLLPVCIALAWSAAGVAFTVDVDRLSERQGFTVAIIAVTLVPAALWIAAADLRGRTGWVPTAVWLVLTNVMPLLAAAIIRGEDNHLPLPPQITAASPIASLAHTWGYHLSYAPRGIAIQAGLLVIPLSFFLYRLWRGRPDAGRPEIDATAPVAAG